MNYYERHIGDYLKDTAHLSLLEHGVYGRLLDVYYTRESAIPAAQVERLIGVRSKEEREALRNVLEEFFTHEAGALRHSRCDREIERYQQKQRKAAASANARWKKSAPHSDGNANADADGMRTHMRTHCDGNAPSNQTPDTRHQTSSEPSGHQQATVQVGPDGPALAVVAAQAMQGAGLADVSASHPKLLALLAAGITTAELADAARVAAQGGRGFPWALARAEGQRRDAAQVGALPAAAPAVDPDSRVAVEAEGVRLGLGKWDRERMDAKGYVEPWSAYAARVKAAKAAALAGGGVAA